MKGMTGYGSTTLSDGVVQIEASISSYNKKSLDLNVRLPPLLSELEPIVRKTISCQFDRGAISVTFRLLLATQKDASLTAEHRFQMLKKIIKTLSLKVDDATILQAILRESDLFSLESEIRDKEEVLHLSTHALEKALKQVHVSREKEGKALSKELLKRIDTLRDIRADIHEKSKDSVTDQIEKLRTRLAQYLEAPPQTDERLLKEIVFYADKFDVSEELERIELHLKTFQEFMKEENAIGKKLEFLLQELMREFNTIGSKTPKADISYLVVRAKTEIEKIREQVQNVE